MHRRHLLALGSVFVPVALSGCLQPSGSGSGTVTDDTAVSIAAQAEQPAAPVEYAVEMVTSLATTERPARLRVTITNPTDATVVLGEERDVQFHHVASDARTIYLYPAGDETERGPVSPGCWQLTEYVAVPEYYGTVPLEAGKAIHAEAAVYGHPELGAGTCLPAGDHRIRTTGVTGEDEAAFDDDSALTEFDWGFTIRVER